MNIFSAPLSYLVWTLLFRETFILTLVHCIKIKEDKVGYIIINETLTPMGGYTRYKGE